MIDIFQGDLVKCLEFGLVSQGSAWMCVRALTVGALEMQDTIWLGFCQLCCSNSHRYLLLLLWLYHSWSSCLVSYINVHVYVQCPHEFSRLYNYTSGIDRNTLIYGLFPACLEFSVFSIVVANHITVQHFSFHQAPITAGWTEAAWSEKFPWHFCTWPALRIAPETFWSLVQFHIH